MKSEALVFLLASILTSWPGLATADEKPFQSLESLESSLLGEWTGGPCLGQLILKKDGMFERFHFSPGDHKLSGTWRLQFKALPPTLLLNCHTSDGDYAGTTAEVKLVQLDGESLAYHDIDGSLVTYQRSLPQEKMLSRELDAFQGTWTPLQYEAAGSRVQGELKFRQIIRGDTVTYQSDGETKASGTLTLDISQNPKHLTLKFESGQIDQIIYVRVGDFVIYCGNRHGKTRPTEFATGTANGGEYLQLWKITR